VFGFQCALDRADDISQQRLFQRPVAHLLESVDQRPRPVRLIAALDAPSPVAAEDPKLVMAVDHGLAVKRSAVARHAHLGILPKRRSDPLPRRSSISQRLDEAQRDAVGSCYEQIDGFDPNAFLDGDSAAVRASCNAPRCYWDGHASERTGIWRTLAVHHQPTEVAALSPDSRRATTPVSTHQLVGLVHDVESAAVAIGFDALPMLAVAA